MTVTNEFERDLINQAQLKHPGRIDMIVFQNIPDVGDGSPGIQRCFRNYLHEGGMEKDLQLIGFGIKGTSVDINNTELQQLSNIGGATISGPQWAYVGALNQDLTTTSNVAFGQITMSGNIIMGSDDITFTAGGLVDGVDVSTFKSDYDTHKASTGADHTYINQDLKTSSSPVFVGLTLSADLITTSTIDGIDVSAIKLNSMPTAADGDIDANTQKIINVVDPTADQDVATKKYVGDVSIEGIASDDLLFSNDLLKTTVSESYVKIKEIIVYRSMKMRLYWGISCSLGTPDVYSKVYINGIAVGTERTNNSTSYVYYTEDIEVNTGDLVQIYGYTSLPPSACRIINMRIKSIEYVSNDP